MCNDRTKDCKLQYIDGEVQMTTREIYKTMDVVNKIISLTPHPYKYWNEKEIYEQIDSSLRAISLGGRLLSNNEVKLGGLESKKHEINHLYLFLIK